MALVGLALGFVLVSLFAVVMLNLTAEVFAWVSGHPGVQIVPMWAWSRNSECGRVTWAWPIPASPIPFIFRWA